MPETEFSPFSEYCVIGNQVYKPPVAKGDIEAPSGGLSFHWEDPIGRLIGDVDTSVQVPRTDYDLALLRRTGILRPLRVLPGQVIYSSVGHIHRRIMRLEKGPDGLVFAVWQFPDDETEYHIALFALECMIGQHETVVSGPMNMLSPEDFS